MNNFSLTTYLTSNVDITTQEVELLSANCKLKRLKRAEYILQQGALCHHVFFVESGLMRQYSIDEKGKEHVIQFAPENWFLSDRESLYFNKPSLYYFQAIEDSVLIMIEEQSLLKLSKINASFLEFNNKLLHNHIRNLQNRINQLLSSTAEQRYLDFVKMYPDLLLRVPLIMVASYLGITPESLSRIRKDLATKNFRK